MTHCRTPFLFVKKHLSLGIMLAILSACGEQDVGGDSAVRIANSSWDGVFRAKKAGAYLDAQYVNIKFKDDGGFLLQASDSDGSRASGMYKEMPNLKQLLFKIEESDLEAFGKAGATRDFRYSLKDNELMLEGEDGEFKLMQEDDPKKKKDDESRFVGTWACKDKNKYQWQLDIAEETFWGRISAENKRVTNFNGHVTRVDSKAEDKRKDDKGIDLKVDNSNNKTMIGLKLRALFVSGNIDHNKIEVVVSGATGSGLASSFACDRAL